MHASIGDRIVIRGHRINEPTATARFWTSEGPMVVRRTSSGGATAVTRASSSPDPTRASNTSSTRPAEDPHPGARAVIGEERS